MALPNICVDRVLPWNAAQLQRIEVIDGRARAIVPIGKLWKNGSTIHVKFLEGNEEQRARARTQAEWWTGKAKANLRFVFDDSEAAEIRVTFDPNDGAWSYVGTDNLTIARDQPTMNLGFMSGGTAGHEFGHAIGLAHEHQNPAGGIQWNEARVISDLSGPPNFWTEEQIRHNVLRKYSVDQIKGTTFDRESIMLYAFPATWTTNAIATSANSDLSEMDCSYVSGPEAYPTTTAQVTELSVDASDRTPARIGNPGEEDLFSFTIHTGGRYLIETRGYTDLMLKLYGPGNWSDLIAFDDDSGIGLNPRVSADLIPGRYNVQVRHYSESEVGDYFIGVRIA